MTVDMEQLKNVLSAEELTAFTLRALYADYGYEKYRMSKFEEYDLYVRNKDFLVSENIITFTDTDGKLLALKPDVTLSILKNAKPAQGSVMKVYYNENVYRVSKGTRAYKELLQAGLECLGEVTAETLTEVVLLAAKSLDVISNNNVLALSELDVVDGVLNACGIEGSAREQLWTCLGERNLAGVLSVADASGCTQVQRSLLEGLLKTYGAPSRVLPMLDSFCVDKTTCAAVGGFKTLLVSLLEKGISEEKLCVDFSVLGNMNYYGGVAFKGFVEGIPTGILSGGCYDRLAQKMGKQCKAVGFAVYLDELNKLRR